jgi:hypothetical protein
MTDEMKHDEQENFEEMGQDEKDSPFEAFWGKQKLAAEEFTKALEELFPPSFREHTRKAGKAFVESFRILFESSFKDFEEFLKTKRKEDTEPEDPAANGPNKVKVQVDD